MRPDIFSQPAEEKATPGIRLNLSPQAISPANSFQDRPLPWLSWWYRLAAPSAPPADAHIAIREAARRGYLTSAVGLCFAFILIVLWIANLSGPNQVIRIVIPILVAFVLSALFIFNRRGNSTAAGIIIWLALNFALIVVILTSPGGLSASSLLLFDMLIICELIVGSTLPVNWIFAPWLINSVFTVTTLINMPKTPELAEAMQSEFALILMRPVTLHLIVTVVVWLWVRGASKAISRADNAEMLAKLQGDIARQKHQDVEQKKALEASVLKIADVHTQIANGNYNARVPLDSEMPLWHIAGSLNNLLTRLQQLRGIEAQYKQLEQQYHQVSRTNQQAKQLEQDIKSYTKGIHLAAQQQKPVNLNIDNPILSPLVSELQGKYILTPPSTNAARNKTQ